MYFAWLKPEKTCLIEAKCPFGWLDPLPYEWYGEIPAKKVCRKWFDKPKTWHEATKICKQYGKVLFLTIA